MIVLKEERKRIFHGPITHEKCAQYLPLRKWYAWFTLFVSMIVCFRVFRSKNCLNVAYLIGELQKRSFPSICHQIKPLYCVAPPLNNSTYGGEVRQAIGDKDFLIATHSSLSATRWPSPVDTLFNRALYRRDRCSRNCFRRPVVIPHYSPSPYAPLLRKVI